MIGMFTTLLDKYKPKVLWPDHTSDEFMYRFVSFGMGIFAYSYPIHHTTPCGVVIVIPGGEYKFINNNWKKKYAYATPEEAFDAFIYRKKKQIQILTSQLEDAKKDLSLAESYDKPSSQEII